MNKLIEKIEIARELKLTKHLNEWLRLQEELSLEMPFTNIQEIENSLIKMTRKSRQFFRLVFYRAFIVFVYATLIFLPFHLCFSSFSKFILSACISYPTICVTYFILAAFGLGRFGIIPIKHSKIDEFEGEIPYGAMLAMKEAKEHGLKDFTIAYPQQFQKADPIIYGFTSRGSMVKIFEWDDKVIY